MTTDNNDTNTTLLDRVQVEGREPLSDTELYCYWRDYQTTEHLTQDEVDRLVNIRAEFIAVETESTKRQDEIAASNRKLINAYVKQQNELTKLYAAQREQLELQVLDYEQ